MPDLLSVSVVIHLPKNPLKWYFNLHASNHEDMYFTAF